MDLEEVEVACLMRVLTKPELERRIADDDAHPDDLIPWEQIKAEALARLKR